MLILLCKVEWTKR